MAETPVRRAFSDPCPICVRWFCLDCGSPRSVVSDHRLAPPSKICVTCRSAHGEYRPVHHYRRDLQESHVVRFQLEEKLHRYDRERIYDLFALVDFLKPELKAFETAFRTSLRTRTGYPENIAAINLGNAALLRLEDVIRHWVKDHPEESYQRLKDR